jgi:hypothetical protein
MANMEHKIMDAIGRNCDCQYEPDGTTMISCCASHRAMADERQHDSFVHHLEFARYLRVRLIKAEHSPPDEAA